MCTSTFTNMHMDMCMDVVRMEMCIDMCPVPTHLLPACGHVYKHMYRNAHRQKKRSVQHNVNEHFEQCGYMLGASASPVACQSHVYRCWYTF